jgi:hypothetical protein
MSKFLDNNFFATHLKTLSEHFSKNGGGGGGNGFLESLPFKAFMNDEIHQVNYCFYKNSLIKNTVFEGEVLEKDLYLMAE